MTGSTTSGAQPFSRMARATRRTTPASASMPVLSAAGGRSSASAVSCARDHRVGNGLDRAHPQRVLRREGHDDRGTEDAELLEGLEVGLDAGATAGVRAGNRERDLHRVSISMSSSLQTLIRDLHRRRGRERRGLALAEGVRLVEEALATAITDPRRRCVAGAGSYHPGEGAQSRAAGEGRSRWRTVSEHELDELADTEHPQGIVAVVEPKEWTLADIRLTARRHGPGARRGAGSRATWAPCSAPPWASGPPAWWRSRAPPISPIPRSSGVAWARASACRRFPRRPRSWWRGPGSSGREIWVADVAGETCGPVASTHRAAAPVLLVVGNEGRRRRPDHGCGRRPADRHQAGSRVGIAQRGGCRRHPPA